MLQVNDFPLRLSLCRETGFICKYSVLLYVKYTRYFFLIALFMFLCLYLNPKFQE